MSQPPRRRRGFTIVELVAVLGLTTVVLAVMVPTGLRLASHRAQMGRYAEDLRSAIRIADHIAREIRSSKAVLLRSPDGSLRTGREGLVLRGLGGEIRAIVLERRVTGGRTWAFQHLVSRDGTVSRTRLGVVGGLRFRFDARRPDAVRAVVFDVVLPTRSPRAAERVLSSRAVLGGGGGP